jgi:ABC-type uncharacterized transport system substrate-binding protein
MRRRDFLGVFGGTVAIGPLAGRAQSQPAPRRIGIITPFASTDAETQRHIDIFRSELAKLGWRTGENVEIDYRWGDGDPAQIARGVKELVALKPDVLLCRATPVAKALADETRTIPIIFVVVSDPVGDNLVASIGRPGRNLTGFTNVEASLGGKWFGLLKELAPSVTRVSVMFNPKTSPAGGSYYMQLIEAAARTTSMKVDAIPVDDIGAIERLIDSVAGESNSGMVVLPDVLTTGQRGLIIRRTAQRRIPCVYAYRYIVAEGGLASYGVDVADLYRRAAGYADRILRGDDVANLPVQAPVKFELAINLNTAKALGLTVSPSLLALADEVIE